jgi:hypothetical protein
MEVDGVFLDVRFDRQEILIDEGRDFIVGIGFGLQPNARASSRSSAEVEQQGLLVSLCLSECRINVFVPLNSHFRASLRLNQTWQLRFLSTTKLSNSFADQSDDDHD